MKILNCIFCEDIRAEQNNKLSLMGVFNSRIVLYLKQKKIKYPVIISLACYLKFLIEEGDNFDQVEVSIYLDDESVIFEESWPRSEEDIIPGVSLIIPIARHDVLVSGQGILSVKVEFFKNKKVVSNFLLNNICPIIEDATNQFLHNLETILKK